MNEFTKKEFEDSPRFIPMEIDGMPGGWYLFDTEKLDYLGFSNFYTNIHECNIVCDIINTIDYILKDEKK